MTQATLGEKTTVSIPSDEDTPNLLLSDSSFQTTPGNNPDHTTNSRPGSSHLSPPGLRRSRSRSPLHRGVPSSSPTVGTLGGGDPPHTSSGIRNPGNPRDSYHRGNDHRFFGRPWPNQDRFSGWDSEYHGFPYPPFHRDQPPHGRWVDDPYHRPPHHRELSNDAFSALQHQVAELTNTVSSLVATKEVAIPVVNASPRPPSSTSSHSRVPSASLGAPPLSDSSLDESDNGDSPELVVEKVLPWEDIASSIIESHPDAYLSDVSDQTRDNTTSNLVEMVEKAPSKAKLSLFPAMKKGLENLASTVLSPPVTSKSRVDADPLSKGVFPAATNKGLPTTLPVGLPKFHSPSLADSKSLKLLPTGKTSFPSTKSSVSEDTMRKLELDARVNLSSLSYALWCISFAKDRVESLREEVDAEDSLAPIFSSLHYALSHLSTTMDCSSVNLVTNVLIRRDTHMSHIDPLLDPSEVSSLRASSFLSPSLFANTSDSMIKSLEARKKEKASSDSV